MALLNKGVNIGHSSRLGYDRCYFEDRLSQSVGPVLYKLNPNQINNCESCLSVFGPRSGHNGYGVSTTVGHRTAPAQDLVDVESILMNRNVIASKCKDGKVNDIDVTKFQLQHARVCNDFLDPIASHLTNPPASYRELAINRFHDLPTHPQANIFWDFSTNTQLEAKDNYRERALMPYAYDPALPKEFKGLNKPCKYPTHSNCKN
jgi:hypothetical protein